MPLYYRCRPAGHPDLKHPTRGLVRAHSWSRGFFLALAAASDAAITGLLDTSDVFRAWNPAVQHFDPRASDGDDTNGLVIGNGVPGPTIHSPHLIAQIPSQSPAAGVFYNSQDHPSQDYSTNPEGMTLTFERTFQGNAAADTLVTEIGLYVTDGTYHYMTIADALGSPITLPKGLPSTLQYVLSTSIAP